jgi:hypothetical protein
MFFFFYVAQIIRTLLPSITKESPFKRRIYLSAVRLVYIYVIDTIGAIAAQYLHLDYVYIGSLTGTSPNRHVLITKEVTLSPQRW